MVEGQPFTFGDAIQILATHNAYHLGKIVALRQFMGAWPPFFVIPAKAGVS